MSSISDEQFRQVVEQTFKQLSLQYNIDLQPGSPLRLFLENAINAIMRGERDAFLSNVPDNKANGFYSRFLDTAMGKLSLSVPRDRNSDFRPQIIPDKYVRNDESYSNLLQSLIVNGYSDSSLRNTLKALGLSYSQSDLDHIVKSLKEELMLFKTRQLPEQVLALFIDAYHCSIRSDSRVSEHACYIIVGIDLKGQKDIFGVYTFLGNESSLNWNVVLRDLFDRGLKEPCIIVSDDFPGLHEKIKMVYPKAHHQLCLVHLQRNIKKNLAKQDASQFNEQLKQLIHFDDVHTGKVHLEKLFNQYMNNPKYASYIKTLFEKIEQYTAFLNFPKAIRKHLYTTNVVESLNSLVEKIRISQGGYFNSTEILELNIYLKIQNLKQTKWKNSVPRIAGEAYEVLQIYNVMYKLSE